MTTQRAAIFKPLGFELTRQMEAVMGRTREDVGSVDLPPRPPETKEVIESKLIPCERCGTEWQCSSSLLTRLMLDTLKITPTRCIRIITTSTCRPGSLALHLGEGPLIERPAETQL